MSGYAEFLERKAQADGMAGFDPSWLPGFLFPFQQALTEWAIRKGRAALFEDCGLGKSPQELVWARNVHEHTGKPVLILTPLAVTFQMEAEAAKFGVDAAISRDGQVTAPVVITNYERLEKFDRARFGGVVCDESSAIKAFDGVRRALVTDFARKLPYRLLGTATAAPNDYIELGTSSEALGYLGHQDMITRFFTNKENTIKSMAGKWRDKGGFRFKGHAEDPFWRWVASWARACRRPSDLGYADDGFNLPPLEYRQHVVKVPHSEDAGTLFEVAARGLHEERAELRRSITQRCELAAKLSAAHDISIVWCHLNAEGDLLERLVPNAIQVQGSDSDEYKEAAAQWFTGRLCICDHPAFRTKLAGFHRKLAAWDGSPNTLLPAAPDTRLILPNGNDGALRAGHQRPTANTCASTTRPIPGSSAGHQNSRLNTTGGGATATPVIQHSHSGSATKHGNGSEPIPRNDSLSGSGDSGSPPASTGPSSNGKAAAAPSAGESPNWPAAPGSTSTTATNPGQSAESCALPAIQDSASSGTTPHGWNALHCICGYASGERRLITKPVMFGLGLNFQHCAHVVYFPSHSYEQFYQAIRRVWRFGQTRPVIVDIVTAPGGAATLANLQRKAAEADAMFTALTAHMNDALAVARTAVFDEDMEVPSWAR